VKEVLLSHLKNNNEENLQEKINLCYSYIGGREKDLIYLIQSSASGRNIDDTLRIMVENTKDIIRRNGFGENLLYDSEIKLKWTKKDMWNVINRLIAEPLIPYDKFLFEILLGNEEALRAMIDAQVIAAYFDKNQRKYITTTAPLFRTTFKLILNDELFTKAIKREIIYEDIQNSIEEMKAIEDELYQVVSITGNDNKKRKVLEKQLNDETENYIRLKQEYDKLEI